MSDLFETRCDDCDKVIGFMGSQPRGFLICPECKEVRDQEEANREMP